VRVRRRGERAESVKKKKNRAKAVGTGKRKAVGTGKSRFFFESTSHERREAF